MGKVYKRPPPRQNGQVISNAGHLQPQQPYQIPYATPVPQQHQHQMPYGTAAPQQIPCATPSPTTHTCGWIQRFRWKSSASRTSIRVRGDRPCLERHDWIA